MDRLEDRVVLPVAHLHDNSMRAALSQIHLALHHFEDVRAPPPPQDLGVRARVEHLFQWGSERAAKEHLGEPSMV
jgi:hypothetical protein